MPFLGETHNLTRDQRALLPDVEMALESLFDYRSLLEDDLPELELESDGWEPLLLEDIVEALGQIPDEFREGKAGGLLEDGIAGLEAYSEASPIGEVAIEAEPEDDGRISFDSLIEGLSRWANDLRLAIEG